MSAVVMKRPVTTRSRDMIPGDIERIVVNKQGIAKSFTGHRAVSEASGIAVQQEAEWNQIVPNRQIYKWSLHPECMEVLIERTRAVLAIETSDLLFSRHPPEVAGVWAYRTSVPGSPKLRQDQQAILSRVREVAEEASKPGWDGDDEDPVDPKTAEVAAELVALFPATDTTPDVSASPRGEIDFDWSISGDVTLIVSVCRPPRHDIVFVAIVEGAEVRGREPWEGTLPKLVNCCFEKMKGLI